MKAITKITATLFLITVSITLFAQRNISGIVYIEGKAAAGVLVEDHRSRASYFTGFDGFYELEVNERSRFVRFTFLDNSKRVNVEDIESDVFNYSFDGQEIPDGEQETGVILKNIEELQRDRDMDFLNSYSLYREFFRQNDFRAALPHWRKVYATYPKSTSQIYIDGVRMMEHNMGNALDGSIKVAYLDSIMQIFDRRMRYLDNNKSELMSRKAALFLENVLRLDLSDREFRVQIRKGYNYAEEAINEAGNNIEPAVLVLFMQSTRRLFSLNEFSQATVLENFEKTMDILGKQLAGDNEMAERAQQAIPLIEQIIETSGALDCAAMVNLYTPKFNEAPNDIEQIKKMLQMFRRYNCENELVLEMSEKLYKLEPSPEAAYNMARTFISLSNYTRAFEYYQKAFNSDASAEQKALYYFEAAGLQLQQGNLQQSRDLLREAIKNKSDYCEAYMMIGEVYVQASRTYSDDDFDRNTVFWVAIDFFSKASEMSNCRNDANNRISTYRSYFPSREEIFFRGLEEGKNHRIGGWINETTTVRARQ